MRIADHAVAPEDVMALLDGELATEEARAVAAHIEECAECGEIARQFRAVSKSMATWIVEDAPAVEEGETGAVGSAQRAVRAGRSTRPSFWNWRLWAIGGAGAIVAIVVSAIFVASIPNRRSRVQTASPSINSELDAAPESIEGRSAAPDNFYDSMDPKRRPAPASGIAGDANGMFRSRVLQGVPSPTVAANPPANSSTAAAVKLEGYTGGRLLGPASSPMIARTVSLTIVVKDVPAARAELEQVLAHYRGYAAQLTVNTPEGGARSFQASLRVPAPELATALADLRALGRVENESQAGEEVTQQHADLTARLQNSRETEQRLKDILAQRTGKIEDVLQVEEEIARVRGEIEGMEADQKTLEHRVDFASVDLQMSEVYKAQLGTPSASVGNQMRNAFVSGLRGAGASLLGVVLFVEEAGPAILVWLLLLGVPGLMLWRRYRRMRMRV